MERGAGRQKREEQIIKRVYSQRKREANNLEINEEEEIMGEYGPGNTAGRCFSMDKERIKHALKGELMCGEDENGFLYEPASREDCERFILSAFDNAVYHCLEAYAFGRIYDHYLEKNGIKLSMQDILISKAIEDLHFQDYQYEDE